MEAPEMNYEQLLNEYNQLKDEHERLSQEYEKLGAEYDNLSLAYQDSLEFYDRTVDAHAKLKIAHEDLKAAYDQLEETTAAKERIESELRIARDIQMSMLPSTFPSNNGLDLSAMMNPAKEVGGDLYGFLLVPANEQQGLGERLYFCIGDVSGKGVPASLFMAQSARLFRTLAGEGYSPEDIAVRMNNGLSEGNTNLMFVTMFIGLLYLDTGRLEICNCGHNPPLIDGDFMHIQYINRPLGIMGDCRFCGETFDDVRGHQLLLYTDGLDEAENRQHELFGDKRVLEIMANVSSDPSHKVIRMLKEAVEKHRDGAEPSDDLTLMCLKLEKI